MSQKIGDCLTIIVDINTNFIVPLGVGFNNILSCLKTIIGQHFIHNNSNQLEIYLIDTYDIYKVYPKGDQGLLDFQYGQDFKQVYAEIKRVISEKGRDLTYQSKITKALAKTICYANKYPKLNHRVTLITSQYFSFTQECFAQFMQLTSYAGKSHLRFDLVVLIVEGLQKITSQGELLEALLLGVHLTNGIYHKVSDEKCITALTLSSLNPGNNENFSQTKTEEIAFKGFCSCCNKVTEQKARACSRCLAVHCDNYKQSKCVQCQCRISEIQ